jgi:hypothetical protein
MIDIVNIIQNAKLGRSRKDAQIDTCSVFAEALLTVLRDAGQKSTLSTATLKISGRVLCYHSVVTVARVHYDSLGIFNETTLRQRGKYHRDVVLDLTFRRDKPDNDDEYELLRQFYIKQLKKSLMDLSKSISLPAIDASHSSLQKVDQHL